MSIDISRYQKGPELAGELTAPCVGLERPGGFSTSSARERNRIELYKQLRKKNYTLIIERENLRFQHGSSCPSS